MSDTDLVEHQEAEDQDPRNITWRSCAGALILLIILGLIPLFGCRLVTQGVLQFGDEDGRFLNVFMLQDPDQEGIGMQWTRTFEHDDQAVCTRTTVRYYMFVGEGENLNYCECSNVSISESLPDMCVLTP
ncbi:MAG: hypothetical protein AB8G95_20770 [Anaerolineae bacterium]